MARKHTVLGSIAVAAAVAGLAVAAAPGATASSSDIQTHLELLDGASDSGSGWYTRAGHPVHFDVVSLDSDTQNEQGLEVLIQLTGTFHEDAVLLSASGEGWTCGASQHGLLCRNHDLVGPGEAWPHLTVQIDNSDYAQANLEIDSKTGLGSIAPGENPLTQSILFDTSQ